MLCGVDYNYCLSIGKDMNYPRNLQGFRGKVLRGVKITNRL